MPSESSQRWMFRFSALTAVITLVLVCIGGLVTSKGVGMSVPDWPTSYGYNMFALPLSTWLTGGVFDEHTHRLVATIVGTLVVAQTRWLGGAASRRPLGIIGVSELLCGLLLFKLGPDWKGAGHFLSGIGGLVLLAAVVPVKNSPASAGIPSLAWAAFVLVQFQGLLGGLRVVLDKVVVSNTTLGTLLGLTHGCLGQAFFVLLCFIALRLSPVWQRASVPVQGGLRFLLPLATFAVCAQLLLGASMRHQHAGLAIHDFPTAYGKVWPATDSAALERYNHARTDEVEVTAFQIQLQMFHRIGAVIAVSLVAACALASRASSTDPVVRRGVVIWACLLGVQFALGAATIWTAKAADVATAHVAVGALSLATGVLVTLLSRRQSTVPIRGASHVSPKTALWPGSVPS